MKKLTMILVVAGMILAANGAAQAGIDMDNLSWSVQYMIDQSQTDFGQSQFSEPRNNRGLAMDPTGRYLYAGYNDEYVRRIDLTVSDYIDAADVQLTGRRGKAIGVDDQGRVYLAEGSEGYISVYDANLGTEQLSISATKCEGVALTREAGTLVLYGTDRTDSTLTRWELTESGGAITGATKAGLDGDGVLDITGADNLRGCAVDSSGRIWMADIDGDKVFRVNSDGTGLTSATVSDAMDIDFDGDRALVTQYTSSTITVLATSDLSNLGTVTPPWVGLELDPAGGDALSGIVVVPGEGFYVANEGGQTANDRSTYGRDDVESGWDGTDYYTDLTHDDNEPILHVVPEPATMSLLVLGGIGVLIRKRRK